MNGYDTVFADAKNEIEDFEVMFDQEDSLIDTIVGCNESGDPLTGAEVCPAKTADERSCDDCNPDYEKDIDADDSKDAPKDAEGTVGYDFEDEPEVDKKDDETFVDPDDVSVDEDFDFSFAEADDPLTGADTDSEKEAEERSDADDDLDYEDIDADDSKDAPKDAEGTVGYDFEDEPEVDKKDDETFVDPDDVKVEEEAELDYDLGEPEGTVDTSPEGREDGDAPTEPTDDCGTAGCGSCCEDVEVSYDFEKQAKKDSVDAEVEEIEDPEDVDSDDILDFVDSDDSGKSLEYDYSDEEIIDDVLNN